MYNNNYPPSYPSGNQQNMVSPSEVSQPMPPCQQMEQQAVLQAMYQQVNSLAIRQNQTDAWIQTLNQQFNYREASFNQRIYAYLQSAGDKLEACSRVQQANGHLFVADECGRLHSVLKAEIENVYHIIPNPLYSRTPFYAIQIKNKLNPLSIEERDYYNPRYFLNELSKACGNAVSLFVSQKKTAELLWELFAVGEITIRLPFYHGWSKEEKGWKFCMSNGKTHGTRYQPAFSTQIKGNGSMCLPYASQTLVAATQFASLMETVINPNIRGILFLWFHAASMYSLLMELGYRVPMGLCLYSSDMRVLKCLETMLAWYGDGVIPLEEVPKRFMDLLTERKDQPMLIRDAAGQKTNTETLLQCLRTGNIPLTVEDDALDHPLQALPTVLSSSTTPISSSSLLVTLDVSKNDFKENAFASITNLMKYCRDYLMSFNGFVAENIDRLTSLLEEGAEWVFSDRTDEWELSDNGFETLKILYGVQGIARLFYSSLSAQTADADRLNNLLPEDWLKALVPLLQNAALCGEDFTDLASLFLSVTQQKMNCGDLDKRPIKGTKETASQFGNKGVVYYNEKYICLTREAFSSICEACGVSGPMVLKALREANLLKGARVNDSTDMTRITVPDGQSGTRSVRVYKLDQELMSLRADGE